MNLLLIGIRASLPTYYYVIKFYFILATVSLMTGVVLVKINTIDTYFFCMDYDEL